jgi:hypothetical protein
MMYVLAGAAAICCAVVLSTMDLTHLWLLAVAAPVVIHAVHLRHRGLSALRFNFGTLVVATYVTLFPFRLIVLALDGWQGVLVIGQTTAADATAACGLVGVCVSLLLLTYYPLSYGGDFSPTTSTQSQDALYRFSRVALVIATLGIVLVMIAEGGPAGVYATFAQHSKAVTLTRSEQLGYTLWILYLPIAIWALTALEPGRSTRRLRVVGVFLVCTVVLLYASRLTAVSALVGAWPLWRGQRRLSSLWKVTAIALLFSIAGFILVSGRTQERQELNTADVLRSASYAVLDGVILVRSRPEALRPAVMNGQRLIAGGSSFVPSAIWPSKPRLDPYRLDSAVANTFGNENQRFTTGFPASFLLEGAAIGGMGGAMLFSLILGVLLGASERRLFTRAATGHLAQVLLGVASVSIFNFIKDGDTVASLQALLKYSLYVLLPFVALRIARDTVPAGFRRDSRTSAAHSLPVA